MSRHFTEESENIRLEMFMDAIMSIIITILVLEFKVPEEPFSSNGDLLSFIHHLLPSFFSYGVSFMTIIALWIDHHFLFRKINKADIRFVFLNFLFILFLSPIPFTTALAGRNYTNPYAVALVAINYFLMGTCFSALWRFAVVKKMIPDNKLKDWFFKRDMILSNVGALVLLASIPLAFVSTYISFVLFILVVLMHLLKHFFR